MVVACILPSAVVRLATWRYSAGVNNRGGGGAGSKGGPYDNKHLFEETSRFVSLYINP